MDDNFNKLIKTSTLNEQQEKKLKFSKKSKINLSFAVLLITFFSIFFLMNLFIYSKLESIEIKLSKINNYFSFMNIDDIHKLETFKETVNILLEIIAGLEYLTMYINIIYLILHPFIGLKFVFVVNLSHYSIIILKIIIQGHRPYWKLSNEEFIKQTDCQTDYGSPSNRLFFVCFFYLYSIISIQKLKKEKKQIFSVAQKIIIFIIHFIIVIVLTFIIRVTQDEFFHQLIFSAILGYILICVLLAEDKKIHMFIFQTLKNVYNARRYKIKIFFYIIGLMIITLISTYFIDEKELIAIKQILKDCQKENSYGIRESVKDIVYIFGIVGAVWGSSYTLEKNINKWWIKSSNSVLLLKIIIAIIFNGLFIVLKYFLPKLIKDLDLNFVLNSFINFFQNFLTFGIIPLLFQKFGLIKNDGISKNEPIKINKEDEKVLFKTSIFKEEKEKDEGFIVVDKIIEEDNKNPQINIQLGDDDKEHKNKEQKGEIYENSNLVENVQNLEDEEDDYLYLEGID